jgi:hypothetical protein
MQSKRSFLDRDASRHSSTREREIECMFRRLLKNSRETRHQSDVAQRQQVAAWIFIVMLGLVSLFALYMLYVKTSVN